MRPEGSGYNASPPPSQPALAATARGEDDVLVRASLPDWLPIHNTPPDVETAVAQARQSIRMGDDTIFLTGDGALRVAGAVAARLPGTIRCLRLAGAETLNDARLLLGWALGLGQPGEPGAASAALAAHRDPLIIVDARGAPPDLCDHLRAHVSAGAVDTRWMIIVEGGLAPTNSIGARLSAKDSATPMTNMLPRAAHALGWLLAGIPGSAKAAHSAQVPGLQRQAIWPHDAEALRNGSQYSVSQIADALGAEFDRHLQIALGSPVPPDCQPADYLALRWIGHHATQPTLCAMAIAAAARLAQSWGLTQDAQSLLDTALPRTATTQGSCRAVLLWAQADRAMAQGDGETGQRFFEDATAALREERNLALLALVTRRWAERLYARGQTNAAALHLRNARTLYRQLGQPNGVAATLRGAADVAIISGETLSAEALFEQAEISTTSPVERINLLLSQATLSIARGDHAQATALLNQADSGAGDVTLLRANLHRRRADLTLRDGDHDTALEHARRALRLYTREGETASAGRAMRLIADIHGARGALRDAGEWYQRAIQAQVLNGDKDGLRRSLTHAAALEAVVGDPTLTRELNRIAARL